MLFKFVISPFAYFLKSIYFEIYSIINDYGISLLFLSIVTSIIIKILNIICSGSSRRENLIRKILNPQINKIKIESKGIERHIRIKNLYKRYDYNPIYAFRSIIPFVIQLPFLFAAYYMLSELQVLEGKTFLLIQDLSKPDGLINGFNFLPILMTIINILAGLLSTQLLKKEKIQALFIASLFLLLLYNAPSSLLIYWTFNNFIFLIAELLKNKNYFSQYKFSKKFRSFHKVGKRALTFLDNTYLFISKYINKRPRGLLEKPILIYPLVFSIIPILSLYSSNIAEVYFSQTLPFLLLSIFLTIFVIILSQLIFNNIHKTGIFVFICLLLFFSYGRIFNEIEDWRIIGLAVGRSRYLLPICVIILSFAVFSIKKTKKNLSYVTKGLNFASIIIVLLIIVNISIYQFKINTIDYFEQKSEEQLISASKKYNDKELFPQRDIYYIILDGYGSSEILKTIYSFDNSEFENYLKQVGFYIANESKSNYPLSFLSLASSLNMEYVNYVTKIVEVNSIDRRFLYSKIQDNKVKNILKENGYKFIHFSSEWGPTNYNKYADINYLNGSNEFEIVLIQTTILRVFQDYFVSDGSRRRILFAFSKLANLNSIVGPKFVFAHIVLPHPPYVFGPNGEKVSDSKLEMSGDIWKDKKKYLNQIIFGNKKLKLMINNILSKSKISPIIILQADHGPASELGIKSDNWSNPNTKMIKERFSILNAYLLPDSGSIRLYNKISPVNTFRVIFNYYFNMNYEMLKDSAYFSTYDLPYKFTNVTNILK